MKRRKNFSVLTVLLHENGSERDVKQWMRDYGIKKLLWMPTTTWEGSWIMSTIDSMVYVENSSAFSALYPDDRIFPVARLLFQFYKLYISDCRLNLGPLKFGMKGNNVKHIVTVECHTNKSITVLKTFVDKNKDFLHNEASWYVNLPLDDKFDSKYYPEYDRLQKIKRQWDPQNTFDVSNGIQLPHLGNNINMTYSL